jgi:hypothetical protein
MEGRVLSPRQAIPGLKEKPSVPIGSGHVRFGSSLAGFESEALLLEVAKWKNRHLPASSKEGPRKGA